MPWGKRNILRFPEHGAAPKRKQLELLVGMNPYDIDLKNPGEHIHLEAIQFTLINQQYSYQWYPLKRVLA